ncbi:glycerate kinase-like [Leptopilina heterotoma]|uniref:glycerate kinase-like n=1 Tax=Leptopilina heterotoma TaxID=63436 RepID=UPI001CAA2AB1|nr:glycerate kinase-like [Leptopilina heterotoma]
MSDVPGDNINEIAGAPTVNESPTTNEVNAILHKYQIPLTILSLSMRQVLNEVLPAMPKKMVSASGKFKFVDYHIIAGNCDAADGMAKAAFKFGYVPVKVNSSCTGTSRRMSRDYVKFASLMISAVEGKISKLEFYKSMMNNGTLSLSEEKIEGIFSSKEKWGLGLYLIFGGRGKVKLTDSRGQGGPNQEIALYFSIYWYLRCRQYPILKEYVVWFLGGASSGKDGNSQVAGAYGYLAIVTGVWKYYQELKDLNVEAKLMMMDLDPESKENEVFITNLY